MRYKTILAKKIEEEEREDEKQRELQEKAGIQDENIIVKKNPAPVILKHTLISLLNVIRYILVAIGVLAVAEPNLREALIFAVSSFL